MPRSRQRVCLESGLKLDLNKLIHQRFVVPNALTLWSSVWPNSYLAKCRSASKRRWQWSSGNELSSWTFNEMDKMQRKQSGLYLGALKF